MTEEGLGESEKHTHEFINPKLGLAECDPQSEQSVSASSQFPALYSSPPHPTVPRHVYILSITFQKRKETMKPSNTGGGGKLGSATFAEKQNLKHPFRGGDEDL